MVVAATSRGVFTVSGDGKARAWPELPGGRSWPWLSRTSASPSPSTSTACFSPPWAQTTGLTSAMASPTATCARWRSIRTRPTRSTPEQNQRTCCGGKTGSGPSVETSSAYPKRKKGGASPIRPGIAHVRTIAVHPLEADVVYVGIEVGSLLITRDRGGQTWEEIDGLGHDIHRVVLHPEAPDRLIVTTGQDTKPYRGGKGIYRSTDRGSSWVQSNNGLGERNYTEDAIVVHPADPPDVVFLAAADGIPPKWAAVRRLVMGAINGNVYFLSPSKLRRRRGADVGFFRSNDGGASWVRLNSEDDRGLFDMVWALEGELTEGGELLLYHGTTAGGLYVSEDEGHTWKCLADGLGAITHIATPKKGTAQ